MNLKFIVNLFTLFTVVLVSSQENLYTSYTIPDSLKQNANAVLRLDETNIEISSIKNLKHSYLRIITVLNKEGDNDLNTYVYYDDKNVIKELRAKVYNNLGKEIKKYKKGDFKDVSAVSSFSLYEDSRVKYLDYTPIEYPYTVEFYYETETKNTAWIPTWRPLEGYYLSTQTSTYQVVYDASVGMNVKEKNFSNYSISNKSVEGVINYKAQNMIALKPEAYSPKFREFGPRLLITPQNFHYEGYDGVTGDWNSIGKWFYDKLLVGRGTVLEETKDKIKELVSGIEDPIEKAKIVYKFVQDNTRYISVQEGIGGIQPISAFDVDQVKYGDCKGLTNYTKALLSVVGVESYYTRAYASPDTQIGLEKDFTTFLGQTNHVILNIPDGDNNSVWLECTSQSLPFGFIGDFTDNRDVFVITPEGGKIVHTKKYTTEENLQNLKGSYSISSDGNIFVNANIVSKGIQYDKKYWLEKETQRDLDVHYKKRWKYINNMDIKSMSINNDKDNIEFNEIVDFDATNYSKMIGDRMLININVLNRNLHVPDRYRNRKLPFKVNRGFKHIDETEIKLPSDYKVEALPKNKSIENKFGNYKTEITVKDESTLVYKREFIINDGEFPKEDYSSFRGFYKEVTKQDNAKIALIKK
ncbi:DUF3857 domain-containing protein [uncultured Algibacter sp.]|uniref:DUF3857 domain-containing protein n=1 Tax=uncultured Algibacter sp. TaxID=298659 RepID=UPI00262B9FBA|nr:DUF3857 domain-containing protein [uncultured Algibacter sp.]